MYNEVCYNEVELYVKNQIFLQEVINFIHLCGGCYGYTDVDGHVGKHGTVIVEFRWVIGVCISSLSRLNMCCCTRKLTIFICAKTKSQISCALNAQLISAFVSTSLIV